MAIPLKPEHLAAAYNFLRALPPFSGWKLPVADEVEFVNEPDPANLAHYTYYLETGEPIIGWRYKCEWPMTPLLMIMAHEMIHLYQQKTGKDTKQEHNKDFKTRARAICKIYNWDYIFFSTGD